MLGSRAEYHGTPRPQPGSASSSLPARAPTGTSPEATFSRLPAFQGRHSARSLVLARSLRTCLRPLSGGTRREHQVFPGASRTLRRRKHICRFGALSGTPGNAGKVASTRRRSLVRSQYRPLTHARREHDRARARQQARARRRGARRPRSRRRGPVRPREPVQRASTPVTPPSPATAARGRRPGAKGREPLWAWSEPLVTVTGWPTTR